MSVSSSTVDKKPERLANFDYPFCAIAGRKIYEGKIWTVGKCGNIMSKEGYQLYGGVVKKCPFCRERNPTLVRNLRLEELLESVREFAQRNKADSESREAEFQSQLQERTTIIKTQRKEINSLKSEKSLLEIKAEKSKEAFHRVNARLPELEQRKRELEDENATLRKAYNAIAAEGADHTLERERLLTQLKTENLELATQTRHLRSKSNGLERKNQCHTKQIAALEHEHLDLLLVNGQLQKQVGNLGKQNRDLRKGHKEVRAQRVIRNKKLWR